MSRVKNNRANVKTLEKPEFLHLPGFFGEGRFRHFYCGLVAKIPAEIIKPFVIIALLRHAGIGIGGAAVGRQILRPLVQCNGQVQRLTAPIHGDGGVSPAL